ncbi:MAG: PDZ domain-containing protein [Planctomycetota bacterium]
MNRILSSLLLTGLIFGGAGLSFGQQDASDADANSKELRKIDAERRASKVQERADRQDEAAKIAALKQKLAELETKKRAIKKKLQKLHSSQGKKSRLRRHRGLGLGQNQDRHDNLKDLLHGLGEFQFKFDNEDLDTPGMRLDLNDLFSGRGLNLQLSTPGQGTNMSMKTDDEGHVTMTIEETDEDGNQQRSTYEADSLEELYRENPELKEKFKFSPGNFQFPQLGDLNLDFNFDDFQGQFDRLRKNLVPGIGQGRGPGSLFAPRLPSRPNFPSRRLPSNKGRLGVTVSSIDDDKASVLDGEKGMVVNSVAKASLAERLGIQVGDILIKVNGTPINKIEAVGRTIRATDDDEEVEVELFRPNKGMRTFRALKSPCRKAPRPSSRKV